MMSGSDVCMAYARALRSAVTGTRVVTAHVMRAATRMRTPGHTGCTVDGGAECAASARRRNRVRRNAGGRVLQAAAAQMLAYAPGAPCCAQNRPSRDETRPSLRRLG